MSLYCGIDLHSNNHFVCVIDEKDNRIFESKLDNNSELTIKSLSKYKRRLKGIAVESTYNWYWLVDALMDSGFHVDLVNTAKVVQYEGLKHTNDKYDAYHLAHLMRLGILPTGHIYQKETRGLRDLLRKRMQLVQTRSAALIRFKSMIQLHSGKTIRADTIKAKKFKIPIVGDRNVQLALESEHHLIRALISQIKLLEQSILNQLDSSIEFELLKSIPGIGEILASTIWLEIGDINRFKSPGNFASYCRCVNSRRESNGKKKGENNRKNGNKYLAWAFIEAANFCVRHCEPANRFCQKKTAARNSIVARKALAHKLSRACYWVIKNREPFEIKKLF
jgi:transposase